ncbi:MAG: C45 family peptidase, partial [Bacteroidota bacterium]
MLKRILTSSLILVFFISCSEKSDTSTENQDIQTAKVYYVENSITKIPVVVVSGTPYQMGYQLGQAIKDEVEKCMGGFLELGQESDEKYSDANLDDAWNKMLPYIDNRFVEELKGLADGAEVSLDKLRRAHMIPVVSSYACSGVAVWGDATESGDLFQIRNLDFTMDAHLQDYPVIVVYKPDQGIPHIQTSFAGYVASHSGMNAKGIVLGEKGASPSSEYPYNYDGIHFSLIFRTILYDSDNLDETLDMIKNAQLIKRYFLYIGDGKQETMGAAIAVVTTPDDVKLSIYKDNEKPDNVSLKVMDNCIYYTMDNDIAYANLNLNNGKFNSEKMINLSKSVASKGGNLLNVVYNASTLEMWVAYANGSEDACDGEYIYV